MIIHAEGLTKAFDSEKAVDGLNLVVETGELLGLVGPDGAGKTTTLRLLAGLLKVTEGTARVAGFDLKGESESIKPKIGYMAQEFSLYGELTVVENIRFFSEIYGVAGERARARQERLLQFAGLTEFRGRRAHQLSGGMKKKLALACTLVHEPEILLLDEPTTGVDPISRREFWEILSELNLAGTTMLVSTPYMDEADRCQRVGLMYAGQLVICDTPERIRASLPGEVVRLRTKDWRAARETVAELPGVEQVQTYGEALHLIVDSAQIRLPEIAQALREKRLEVWDLDSAPPRMEEAFISLLHAMEA